MVAATTKAYYNQKPGASQSFGAYRTPTRRHRGTDFSHSTRPGTLVPALISGRVIGKLTPANWHGFGYQITTEGKGPDGRTYRVSYAHGSKAQSASGNVTQGQYISTEGTTGATSGPCCHVEVFDVARGVYIDPMILVKMVLSSTGTPAGGGGAKPSEAVKGQQRALNTHGYKLVVDGIRGPKTIEAIKAFQRRYGLVPDGIWGPKTNSLNNRLSAARRPVQKFGSRGDWVKKIQKKLKLTQDGIFGPKTKAAVIAFQRKNKLSADGIVGPKTWAKLGY